MPYLNGIVSFFKMDEGIVFDLFYSFDITILLETFFQFFFRTVLR